MQTILETVTETVTSLMPSWKIDEIIEIEYLSGGYSNDNYALTHLSKRYVLRLPRISQPYVNRSLEAKIYRDISQQVGVPAIALDTNSGALLTPWLEGPLLADVDKKTNLEELANYLVFLHSALPPVKQNYNLAKINEEFWQEELPPFKVATVEDDLLKVCHNDLNPWNIIVTDAGWKTLDWEFVGRNDPLFDLVSLHQGLEYPKHTLPDLVELYMGSFTSTLAQRMHDAFYAFWVREYGWACYQVASNNNRLEILQQQERALDILRGLED